MDPVVVGLLVFLVVGAVVALELRDLLSSIIALGVVGLGLSILFLLLGAPDIAITQVVVEVIVVTVLIRGAAADGQRERSAGPGRDLVSVGISLALLVLLLVYAVDAMRGLPPFGHPRPVAGLFYLDRAIDLTGASNVVTAILLDFRGYDTLGEATVILASILGAVVVLRRRPEPGTAAVPPATAPEAEPDLVEVGHG